jgi:hypothetical protein
VSDTNVLEGPEEHKEVSVVRPRLKATQRRAARMTRSDLPWLAAVKLPWGLEVGLLNISETGMLVETSSKFAPGSVAQFQLCGADDDTLMVSAKFVRSEIATVNGLGVKYHAAAIFEKPLDLESSPRTEAESARSSAQLADWLLAISTELRGDVDPDRLRERLEEGLLRLISARDVRILDEPGPTPEGCESVCFAIPRSESTPSVLQVSFDGGYLVSEADFRLLQAAAALAAVILR